jgi:hypothetical protein
MDEKTKKIVAALRKGTDAHLNGMDEDLHDEALINVKTTDLRAVLDALDAALSTDKAPKAGAAPAK